MRWYRLGMSGTYRVTVGDRGRLVLPVELRERADLHAGTPLTLLETPDGLVLLTREQLRKRVRDNLEGANLVEDLLRERRTAAAREDLLEAPE